MEGGREGGRGRGREGGRDGGWEGGRMGRWEDGEVGGWEGVGDNPSEAGNQLIFSECPIEPRVPTYSHGLPCPYLQP